ncbi:MAG TPA: site-specific integrase [Thermoplasmata archaeon]|nr:site-specific integrase [Thermoplasmata archaeon]
MKSNLAWSSATFRLHFAALRPFLRWAKNRLAEEAAAWKVASGETGRRRWLTKEQLSRLVRAARGRERLLVILEGLNGLRRVEVLRLRHRDINSAEGFLNVRGKGRDGGKWRQIPVCPRLSRVLEGLDLAQAPDARLVSLSASGADLLLRRAVERAGFPARGVRISHHDLRRTFGRLSHEAGMDLVQLKNLYGHASLDQTVHYIGLDQAEMMRGLIRLDSLISPLLRAPPPERPSAGISEGS